MKPALNEVRRARPLLGTFVEITAQGRSEKKLHRAIDDAFAAVQQVHLLMSFHDSASDISRLNNEAADKPVRIHPWTHSVLRAAKNLSRESNGVFDIAVASLLRAWHFLPGNGTRDCEANWRDILFMGDRRVRFRRRLIVDLGGIAKGFAVDRATEALIAAGVRSGVVNAGGDLRVFGPKARVVHVRHPREPGKIGRTILLRETSLATSALYYSRSDRDQKSPLIDARTHRPASDDVSVSVYAADCMTADALTKVVFAMRDGARPILNRHRAGSFLLVGESSFCEFSNGSSIHQPQA